LAPVPKWHDFGAVRGSKWAWLSVSSQQLQDFRRGYEIALPVTRSIMDMFTSMAASGMKARMETLDILANNIANSSAPGFKADREFYALYAAGEASPSDTVMPVIERHWTDFSQGSLTPSGNPLDFALRGRGFFTAISPNGPVFTRNGSFHVSSAGELVTQEGFKVRAAGGGAIRMDPSKPFSVSTGGAIEQDGQPAGAIEVVDFKDPTALAKAGHGYFQLGSIDMQPTAASATEMEQGKLESANFQPAESAVRLVGVMRQFEMLQRAVSIGSDMGRRVLDEVAKATP
jgi:flagellar basal-body rod protein FlgF